VINFQVSHRVVFALTLFVVSSASARLKEPPATSKADVEAAQRAWCNALIEIGSVSKASGDAKDTASKILSTAYNYDRGTVLFKPTLTHGDQTFRMTKAGALAYFVGGDSAFPNDSGFALKQWVKCEPKVAGVVSSGDMTIAMGKVHLENAKGDKVTVDKTFGYLRDSDGTMRIVLHHSSLEYSPPK
jgi:hypothetical protein